MEKNHGDRREGATTLYRKSHLSDISFFLSGIKYGESSAISIIITASFERWKLSHKEIISQEKGPTTLQEFPPLSVGLVLHSTGVYLALFHASYWAEAPFFYAFAAA
ncbi:hypothetical protein HAX54_010806 [Datura stramonium]|uniref:Uncharacterized protein n=1 Tax=Datura stramonium TaxID=4076 RepID=A0ABS8RXH7_DATST|nr:hypothetical protein [Datura stramonium]